MTMRRDALNYAPGTSSLPQPVPAPVVSAPSAYEYDQETDNDDAWRYDQETDDDDTFSTSPPKEGNRYKKEKQSNCRV
jgi:hypothetical protein